jgi:hypothetical protein
VRLALQNGELRGQVAVHEAADGTLWLLDAAPGKDPKALHFGLRVPAFLRWAALRASTDAAVRVALVTAKGLAPWGEALAAGDVTSLAANVQALVDYRAAVLAGERRYSPGTSWAAANADADDDEAIVAACNDAATQFCLLAERAYLRVLEGGCSIPVFALATLANNQVQLKGGIVSLDGQQRIVLEVSGPVSQAVELGESLAKQVLQAGGKTILEQIKQSPH